MLQGCLVQVGNDIELDTIGRQFELRTLLVSAAPLWCDLGRCSPGRTVVVIKLRRTSAFFTERNEGVYMLFSMLHNKAASVTAM